MLELYRKQFKDILNVRNKSKRTLLLSNLMSQMESYYQLSMNKERFELETDQAVKELYVQVAVTRVFK